MSYKQTTSMPAGSANAEKDSILACNLGSGSIKLLSSKKGEKTIEGDAGQIVEKFTQYLQSHPDNPVVLHRIVHGGEVEDTPYLVDSDLIKRIEHWRVLAPLHNNTALELIHVTKRTWPTARQYAIFDSALYHDMPEDAKTYALPTGLSDAWPIRRYGFHGIAHRAQKRLISQQGDYDKVITIHVGGGASLSAWNGDKVIDTTMGFTPTDGLPMSSRCGALDPMIVLHLLIREGYSPEQLETLLNKESGLKGISGVSADYRDIKKVDTKKATLAVHVFCRNLTKSIGSLLALLGGVDAIGFGGGLAENQAYVRAQCLAPLETLGIVISPNRNTTATGFCALHSEESETDIWLSPANECEEMMHQFNQSTFRKDALC